MTHDEGYVLQPTHPAFVSEPYATLGSKMTHDKLLKKINWWKGAYVNRNNCKRCIKYLNTLRAVVELHKPTDRYFPNRVWGSDGEIDTGGATRTVCKCGSSSYPCPTIQTIEKELS